MFNNIFQNLKFNNLLIYYYLNLYFSLIIIKIIHYSLFLFSNIINVNCHLLPISYRIIIVKIVHFKNLSNN